VTHLSSRTPALSHLPISRSSTPSRTRRFIWTRRTGGAWYVPARRSDSRPSLSPHFVAFVWRYHPCALFAPSGRNARPWAPGSWYSGSRAGHVSGDGRGSQVPQRPSEFGCLEPPVGVWQPPETVGVWQPLAKSWVSGNANGGCLATPTRSRNSRSGSVRRIRVRASWTSSTRSSGSSEWQPRRAEAGSERTTSQNNGRRRHCYHIPGINLYRTLAAYSLYPTSSACNV
jgi:hypothetical protein